MACQVSALDLEITEDLFTFKNKNKKNPKKEHCIVLVELDERVLKFS